MEKIKFLFVAWLLVVPVFGQTDDLSQKFDWHQSSTGSENYIGKQVMLTPWGGGEGEIPQWQVESITGSSETPTTVIAGQFELMVGKKDDFFISYSANGKDAILDITRSGKVIFVNSDLKKETAGLDVSKLLVDDDGEIHLLHPATETFTKIGVDGKISRFMKSQGASDPDYKNELLLFEPNLLMEKVTDKKRRVTSINFTDKKTNQTVLNFNLMTTKGYQLFLKQLGQDHEGNFFLLTRLYVRVPTVQSGDVYVVYKYSKSGELLTSIYSKIDNYIGKMDCPECCFDVDSQGNIYQLYSSKEGLKIIEWSKQ